MIGVGGSIPYALTLGSNLPEVLALPGYLIVIVTFVQNGVLLAIATFVGLLLAPKVGLGVHILEKVLRREAIHVQVIGFFLRRDFGGNFAQTLSNDFIRMVVKQNI